MSQEHSPLRQRRVGVSPDLDGRDDDLDYWYALIDEKAAAEFIGVTDRTMQAFRQRGGGPRYVVISARCIRYRRIELREWAEARLRTSTADSGPE